MGYAIGDTAYGLNKECTLGKITGGIDA